MTESIKEPEVLRRERHLQETPALRHGKVEAIPAGPVERRAVRVREQAPHASEMPVFLM